MKLGANEAVPRTRQPGTSGAVPNSERRPRRRAQGKQSKVQEVMASSENTLARLRLLLYEQLGKSPLNNVYFCGEMLGRDMDSWSLVKLEIRAGDCVYMRMDL